MPLGVVINGGAGRMGTRILSLLLEDPGLRLVGVLEAADHPAVGRDAGSLVGKVDLGIQVVSSLREVAEAAEVVIDFSSPAATLPLARQVGERRLAMVIGTTGCSEEEKGELAGHLRESAWVLAPNMSVGVNVLFRAAAEVARVLGDGYDVEIVETHHRFKADAPSGTALALAEAVARARGIDLASKARYGREGRPGARDPAEVGILAVRAGDVVGEHTVIFGGMGERVELVHKAHSRDPLALGALRAAKWVAGRPAGRYDMADVLGLREAKQPERTQGGSP